MNHTIVQDSTNKLIVPYEGDLLGDLTIEVEGRTYSATYTRCANSLHIEIVHICDDRNAFNLDIGSYVGSILIDGVSVLDFNFKIYIK